MHIPILGIILLFVVIRLITRPFRFGYRRHRPWNYYGGGYGYGGYGYGNPYGYRRRHGFLFSILTLAALDRLFGGRRF